MDVGFAEREEKKRAEENRCGGLIDSADRWHGEAHHKSGRADDQSTNKKDSADDAMRPEMARAEFFAELEWRQEKKQHARKNVNEREYWIAIEDVVDIAESSSDGTRGGCGRVIAVKKSRRERHDAADCDCAADENQEGERSPESATES